MKFGIFIILAFLLSCEEKPPAPQGSSAPESNPTLAAAQIALAKSHLVSEQPSKAIPYLLAASEASNSPIASHLLKEILASTRFTIPTLLLRHPFPILRFTKDPGKAIFVALGGDHPTVIRWDLAENTNVSAVLFPTDARDISHISLSPQAKLLLVHRDATNLLCDATTLKPIANLGTFPSALNPDTCQPFTLNGLLVANPTKADNETYLWHIRDTTTGESLRTISLPTYPKPIAARFDGSTLCISSEDNKDTRIPVRGETESIVTNPKLLETYKESPNSILSNTSTISILKHIPKTKDLSPVLVSAISGYHLDTSTQTLSEIPIPNRLESLSIVFPDTIPQTLKLYSADSAITQRLAAAYPEQYPAITTPAISQATVIRQIFSTGDSAAILATIDSAQNSLPLATALYLALESENPTYIQRAAANAKDLPFSLRCLIRNDLTSIPDLSVVRLEEDWIGYESPDFSPLFRKSSEKKSAVLLLLSLPDHPTPDDIDALILKLLDPSTETKLGRPTIAQTAIHYAANHAANPELATHSLRLSTIARQLGASPALCLRNEALAFTSLDDFTSAHRSWLDLITNQPEAEHLASDYSEAAYTAFEVNDPRQAIEILHTGLFRFPNDVAFAIRSGWISLLTDKPQDALRYLSHATKLGLPPAEIENTTALLAITHYQLEDSSSASSYLAQLKAISPKWDRSENIDALPWPDSFKSALREIISQGSQNEPAPSPENDPIDTAPLPEQFPIEEPPLPSR